MSNEEIPQELKDLAHRMIADEIANDPDAAVELAQGGWQPGTPSWPGVESLDSVVLGTLGTPEQHADAFQQLRNEQYAKAGLPMPGDAAAGVLRHLLAGVVAATGSIRTQEEFLTALDELLDHTLHSEACYIDPNDTNCVCVIGQVRAVLPACEAVWIAGKGPSSRWTCQRSVHPASPDRHVWAPR